MGVKGTQVWPEWGWSDLTIIDEHGIRVVESATDGEVYLRMAYLYFPADDLGRPLDTEQSAEIHDEN